MTINVTVSPPGGTTAVMLTMTAVVWPIVLLRARSAAHDGEERSRWSIFWICTLLLAPLVILIFACFVLGSLGIPNLTQSLATLASILVVYFVTVLMLKKLGLNGEAWPAGVLGLLSLTYFLQLDWAPLSSIRGWYAATVVVAICGAPLIYAYSRFIFAVIFATSARRISRARVGLLLLASAGAVFLLLGGGHRFSAQRNLQSLIPGIGRFNTFVLLIASLRTLRHAPDSLWAESSPFNRELAIVLVVAFLAASSPFYPALIVVSIGYAFFRFIVLQRPALLPEIALGFLDRSSTLAKLVRLNELTSVVRALRRELLAKLGKGEITYGGLRSRLDPVDREVREARQELLFDGVPAEGLILSLGPTRSAWQNGILATGYGMMFSAFWLMLAYRDVAPGAGAAPLLFTINSYANLTLRWALFAFFFGYSFPYIRGNSGISKALWLVAAYVTPSIIATGLFAPSDQTAWLGVAFWALEILITGMLLGLIMGDFETLRRCGYGWRDLMEVHNWSALSAWASTFAIAVGATATTILTSGFGNILTAALRFAGFLPQSLSIPQLPKH